MTAGHLSGDIVVQAVVSPSYLIMPQKRQPGSDSDAVTVEPMHAVQMRADALYRAAVECCRQHDRAAKLHRDSEPELEHQHVDTLCKVCDESLREMIEAYSKAASNVTPDRDEPWWHKANALWHSAREYSRHHAGCEAMSRKVSSNHKPEQLANMQMEYELLASAMLALRQAADAYCRTRPALA
jgi:hypothetical protein